MQLKEIRKELGITQKELADELSVSIPQISRYESGETAMTPDTIIKLCNYLGITTDELLGHIPSPTYPLYNNISFIQETISDPDVFNTTIEYTKKHLTFLEQKLQIFHAMMESSQKKLDLILSTEEKLHIELQQLQSQYDRISALLEHVCQKQKEDI